MNANANADSKSADKKLFTPVIAIIGAGPGGLTLARLLQHHGISCTVYEQDLSRSSRTQGGTLDLHASTGQKALVEAGLYDQFAALMRPEGEAFRVVDAASGKVRMEKKAPKPSKSRKPEIDRCQLREILLDSLQPDTVRWGRRLERVEASGTSYNLQFAGGRLEEGFDLVVGADGAWSRVRSFLTSQSPTYSGVSGFVTSISPSLLPSDIDDLVGQGAMVAHNGRENVWCQRLGDGSVSIQFYLSAPEDWVSESGIDWTDATRARTEVVDWYLTEGWAEIFGQMVKASEDELRARTLYMLPVGFKWERKACVTLIGDAAHLMTPFAGVGVNVAMEDALELARAIIKYRADRGEMVEGVWEYEKAMFERAEKNARLTYKNLVRSFGEPGS